ncbi:MAG: hypothetical protein BroJett018_43490 [Chloroflexota bacterium]|nr:hypothetical protein [Chloroflexota bacterium]NOG65633.1 hypothetical protein [Chloroflexota bacterium]GIK66555.1 MAG: hypothetical protein BroJett018_43490 [Chloroflexota bacterium]
MSSQGFPFDDDNEIDPFAEDFDPFESGSLVEEEDFDLPPDEQEGGISRTFLFAGGFIILAVLLGIVGVVALLLGDDGGDETAILATQRAGTNQAIETAIAATGTRIAEIDATLTVTTARLFQDSTSTAVAAFDGTNTAVAAQLEGSRTAIAFNATQTGAAIQTQGAQFVLSQTPPTATPQTFQAQILDQNGNPVTGIVINIYADDGDGEFNPAAQATVAPTPTRTPTATATVQQLPPTATATPSPSATTGSSAPAAPAGTEEAGDGAPVGAKIQDVGPSSEIFARRLPNDPQNGPAQGGPTPTTGDGQPIQTIVIGPDGAFEIPPLGPGNYFLDVGLPPGTYTFRIGEEQVVINLVSGTQQQTLNLPNGVNLTIIVRAVTAPTVVTLTPTSTSTIDSSIPAFDLTVTAIFANQTASAQPQVITSPTIVLPTQIAQTGLFSDAAEEATPAGLTLLAILGVGLIAVVVVVRRLRSSI